MAVDVEPLTQAGANLFAALGSFWSSFYDGHQLALDYCQARAETEAQADQAIEDAAACAGLAGTPLYQAIRWYPLVLRAADRLSLVPLSYTSSDCLGENASAVLNSQTFEYPLPSGLQRAACISSSVLNAAVVWTQGIDYDLNTARSSLRFRSDPFADSRFAVDTTYDATGAVADQTLTLWLYQAQFDANYLSTHYGSVVRLSGDSSEAYRALLEGIWRAQSRGPSTLDLEAVLAGLTDAPRAGVAGEVVESILDEGERQTILTSAGVYTCPSTAGVVVSAGDVLQVGDRLTDAYEILDLSRGTPNSTTLSALTIPPEQLQIAVSGSLTFDNSTTDLLVSTDGGRTRVEFALGGDAADTDLFWDTVHALGTAVGATSLAQLLDTRPPPQTEDPDATSLPATINPLQFLVTNVLSAGALVVRLRSASYGPDAATTAMRTAVLRRVTPPQKAIFVIES